MADLFLILFRVSNLASLAIATALCVCRVFEPKLKVPKEVTDSFALQLKSCRNTSLIFLFLAWFIYSAMVEEECLASYAGISGLCSKIGCIWIGFAFACVVLNVAIGLIQRKAGGQSGMEQLRGNGIRNGVIFLPIAFALNI